MGYQFQAFISYSTTDLPWAEKIEADLQRRGIRCFRDRTALVLGKPWPDHLRRAMDESEHLVVLWSDNARASDWVAHEMTTFELKASSSKGEDRRMFLLELQGNPPPMYASTLSARNLRGSRAYSTPPDQWDDETKTLWRNEIDRIGDEILGAANAVPIPLTVVAMTGAEAQTLTGNEMVRSQETLAEHLTRLGLGGVAELRTRYGGGRMDWRPFGGNRRVEELLDDLLAGLNNLPLAQPPAKPFRWQPIEFISLPFDEASKEVKKLLAELAVIVVDPLSLYHNRIQQWFPLLDPCFEWEQAVVMVLTPFAPEPLQLSLREFVQRAGTPQFNFYYDPPIPSERTYPLCVVNVSDSTEMTRTIRVRMGMYAKKRVVMPVPTALRT
jgi:hypothetical protein